MTCVTPLSYDSGTVKAKAKHKVQSTKCTKVCQTRGGPLQERRIHLAIRATDPRTETDRMPTGTFQICHPALAEVRLRSATDTVKYYSGSNCDCTGSRTQLCAGAEYGSVKVGNRFACGYNTLFWYAFLSIRIPQMCQERHNAGAVQRRTANYVASICALCTGTLVHTSVRANLGGTKFKARNAPKFVKTWYISRSEQPIP